MIKFTFIIPHYNLPAFYLRRMLDSIPHRDDVQIIIIDDNSDSPVVDFDSFPGDKEQCTEVIYLNEHQGPGFARNLALARAKGEWIFFADADDSFNTECLLKILAYCSKCEEDLLCVGVRILHIDGSVAYDCYGYEPIDDIVVVKDFDITPLYINGHQSYKRVVRRSLIERASATFPEISYCEDIRFAVCLLDAAQNMAICPIVIYNYIRRESSITGKLEFANLKDAMNETISLNRYYKKTNKNCYLVVSQYLLSKIYRYSYVLFIYYVLKEIHYVTYNKAKSDYVGACLSNGVSPNPITAIIDYLRVKIGVLIK